MTLLRGISFMLHLLLMNNHISIDSLNDKPNLSYFEATLNEVQRIVGLAYMGIFRIAKVNLLFKIYVFSFIIKPFKKNRSLFNIFIMISDRHNNWWFGQKMGNTQKYYFYRSITWDDERSWLFWKTNWISSRKVN